MDCNNYSYVNSSNNSNTMAEYIGDGRMVYFTLEINYFNEYYYSVMDILNDDIDGTFEFSRWSVAERCNAYEKAARFYNSLVPEERMIPVF